ncbi:TetR/AcrR family transcriptional regulator [Eubacterium sp.]|uniref:TetR/AcrR family transcriptional regulator n=1 Tax=Eubacterium sp. TaxID=142586 RepID=UPI0025EB183C|nr:TetR/AcrR family transcriptional regulator [Eubacterium sp.]MCR5628003.1 TetR/AcrR family transcriptional regulator [Eubacterium sp.]
MPRNKEENHEKIIAAAYDEFLEYGFVDASMRRIANNCGMSASGLYKHFPSKEDMFAALVDPTINGLMELYGDVESDYSKELKNTKKDDLWVNQKETIRAISYIYDHINEFKLIICKSQGTKYENFIHDMAIKEEEVTLRYMKELKKKGIPVKRINKKEFHLLVSSSVDAIFQVVLHNFTKKEAMHYAKTLDEFYLPAWKQFFGI